ncbi:MAG: hypothetical protein RBU21_10235 [FCB group bacterium]|jgi:hypothetical protein|nr:hypothetical protein [FCB group bacterium]
MRRESNKECADRHFGELAADFRSRNPSEITGDWMRAHYREAVERLGAQVGQLYFCMALSEQIGRLTGQVALLTKQLEDRKQ